MLDDVVAFLLFGLCLVPITAYFNQFLFYIFSIYVASKKFHKREQTPLAHYPGVSILKPLLGVNPELRENLVSHFELQYPNFELVFCVESPTDPAIEQVHALFREYPNVDARLLIGGHGDTVNPLVNNVLPGYETAKYSLCWFSSSRVKVNTDMMLDLVRKSEHPDVAIVHQMPYTVDQRGLWDNVEKICFGCSLGRSCIALNHMGILCFTGMSYIIKKPIFDKFGGYANFGNFLAEDYFIARQLVDNGYKIIMCNYPAMQNVGESSFEVYNCRMVRWLRLRLNMLPLIAAVFEPLIECLNLGFLVSLTLNYLFQINIPIMFMAHICVWITLDYILLKCVNNGPLNISFFAFLCAWWTRELMTYVIYVKAIMNPRTIKWGQKTYSLTLGGVTKIAAEPPGYVKAPPYSRLTDDLKKSANPTTEGLISGAVNPAFSGTAENAISPPPQSNGHTPGAKSLRNGAPNFSWKHFPNNGYTRSKADSVRRLDPISVNAALMTDT